MEAVDNANSGPGDEAADTGNSGPVEEDAESWRGRVGRCWLLTMTQPAVGGNAGIGWSGAGRVRCVMMQADS